MKKHTQRQLLGLLTSIAKGITYIKDNVRSNQTETVQNDCNVAIQSVNKTIQSELSEGAFLAYKDLFLKAISNLEQSAKVGSDAERKQLLEEVANALNELGEVLQKETEINKEIVFFPYKASMWDSLESIWKAAMEDPSCDCYVVPIPYVSNGKTEYEGHLFPKDVPVIHYSLYKMEVQLPDVTYIHNPYDNYNKVTQVDPSYFTSELKKHTKKLVYVPYFVLEGEVPDHFCNLPSLKNIDLVVVQSDQHRETYLKFVPEEKIAALGSPKFDKVLYHQENGIEIPPTWKEKIDGKKVVLYNTSLAVMIENPPVYLNKLKGIIEEFSRNEEMVLLWRPHPLMKSTLQSMYPQCLTAYQQIEQFFVQNQFGILDVSPDPHLAIAVADAYYGDPSSLFPQFAATGKPMVVQDIMLPIVTDTNKSKLGFEALAVKDKKTMYGFSSDLNALFQIDLVTGSLKFLGSIPNTRFSDRFLCASMEVAGDKIVLAPFKDRNARVNPHFIEYSISKDTFTIRELQGRDSFKTPWNDKSEQQFLFNSAFKLGNSVFLIPYQYGAIVEFDVETEKCTYHTAPLDSLDKSGVRSGYFSTFGCKIDDDLYLPLADSNQVLKFSMVSGEFNWLKIGKKESRFSSCHSNGDTLWLASFTDGSITKFDLNKSRIESHSKMKKGIVKYNDLGALVGSIITCESSLLLVPKYSNGMTVYHTDSEKIEQSDIFPASFPVTSGQYSKSVRFENLVYLFNNCSRNIVKYTSETNKKEEIVLTLSDEDADKLCAMKINELRVQQSDHGSVDYLRDFNLSELLSNGSAAKHLKKLVDCYSKVEGQTEFMQSVNVNMDGSSGEKILGYVLETM